MKVTYQQIKDFGPCYDPVKYIPENYEGSIIDILRMTNVPAKDRLWVAVRADFLTDRQLRLHSLGCARMAEKYTTDDRVKMCNDVTERYLNSMATKEELQTADSAADSASSAAQAASLAAYSAAQAARAAYSSAQAAAWSATEENQVSLLIKILEEK